MHSADGGMLLVWHACTSSGNGSRHTHSLLCWMPAAYGSRSSSRSPPSSCWPCLLVPVLALSHPLPACLQLCDRHHCGAANPELG